MREDIAVKLKPKSIQEGYVENLYRESLDRKGNLTYIGDHKKRLKLIKNLYLYDIEKRRNIKIGKLYSINS